MIGSGGEVLGRHIVMVFGGKLDIEIVGVVEDVFTDIKDAQPLALYMPMSQQAQPPADRALVFRAAGDVGAARRPSWPRWQQPGRPRAADSPCRRSWQ